MKFYHELEKTVFEKIKDGINSAKELIEHPEVRAHKENAANHPSGLSREELGAPPLPPGFVSITQQNFKHDVGAVIGHLIRQGRIGLVDGKLKVIKK